MSNQKIEHLVSLENKTAIVTGGSMGIGEGIVRRLHEAGARVVIADLDGATAQKLALELNSARQNSVVSIPADISKIVDIKAIIKLAQDRFDSVDILVNNAGIFPYALLADLTESMLDKVLSVNVKGVFLMTKYAARAMKEHDRGGRIINITSIDALHPSMAGLAHYDASKHGIWGFTKNVALELAKDRIWVNAVAPGGIATPGVAKMSGGTVDRDAFARSIPMGRMGEPDDIGRVVLFLASDLASYITGTQIVVDGGALLT